MTHGKARRAANLYSRWHADLAVVFLKRDGEYDWTAVSIEDGERFDKSRGTPTEYYLEGRRIERR